MFLSTFCLAALLHAPDPASMAADGVLPVALPEHVRAYTDALELEQDQIDTVRFVIEDYQDSMRELHQAMLDRAAASRSALDDAFAGRRRMSMDEIRSLREDVESAPRQMWPQVDAALDDLTETLAVLCVLEASHAQAAKRAFRRRVLLDSVVVDGTASSAALGFDLERLVDRARGQELSTVDAMAIEGIMQPWLVRLDARLSQWIRASRSADVDDSMAEITQDHETRIATMKAAAARWRAQVALHAEAVQALAELAQVHGGDEARGAWLQRVEEASFPGLYDDHRLRVTSEWVETNGSLTQRDAVVQAHAMWIESCRPVAHTMADLLRQGFEQGVDLQHDAVGLEKGAVELRRAFLQASGDRQVRLETAKASIDRHLTEGQRAAVRRIILDQRRR